MEPGRLALTCLELFDIGIEKFSLGFFTLLALPFFWESPSNSSIEVGAPFAEARKINSDPTFSSLTF